MTPQPGSFTGAHNTGAGGRPSVNGNREQTNNFTIDGIDMNEWINNWWPTSRVPTRWREISVETNNYSADTGNVAGAVISNVIKSGTNQFRGNAFEFYRNNEMDANSVLQQSREGGQAGAQAEHLRRHDRRAARQEQGVLLRQLPGDALRSARVGARVGRARELASRRPALAATTDHTIP